MEKYEDCLLTKVDGDKVYYEVDKDLYEMIDAAMTEENRKNLKLISRQIYESNELLWNCIQAGIHGNMNLDKIKANFSALTYTLVENKLTSEVILDTEEYTIEELLFPYFALAKLLEISPKLMPYIIASALEQDTLVEVIADLSKITKDYCITRESFKYYYPEYNEWIIYLKELIKRQIDLSDDSLY